MPAGITMTLDERRKYLLRMRLRYVQANRTERNRLLDEMEQVTELHRKSLLRLMKAEPVRKLRQQQRGRTYNHEVDDAIRVVAESLDYICASSSNTRFWIPCVTPFKSCDVRPFRSSTCPTVRKPRLV